MKARAPRRRSWSLSLSRASAVVAMLALAPIACTDPICPDAEAFVVDENGTCAPTTQRLTLTANGCRVFINSAGGDSGLPATGAMGPKPVPLRQGNFILYSDQPAFRLCRARRVDFRLELSCVDSHDAPVCQANLTEPAP
jgi:hypothetical protein